ncbi:MAG: hypothetical protein H0Z35_12515 [Thermoanaerobacteraceae bacterium]|nr:hypothetical protein [Thermoanaerobacteraceae bacterium]
MTIHWDGDYKSSVLNQLTVIRANIQLGNKEAALKAVDELAEFHREENHEKVQGVSACNDQRLADCANF